MRVAVPMHWVGGFARICGEFGFNVWRFALANRSDQVRVFSSERVDMLFDCLTVQLGGQDEDLCLHKLNSVNKFGIGCCAVFPQIYPGGEWLGVAVVR